MKLGLGLGLGSSTLPWFLSPVLKADSVLPSLVLDYENGRYAVNQQPKTFSDIHTFTRSSTATYVDESGEIQTAAINEPRFDYSTGMRKLLMEEQRTNLLERAVPSLAYWDSDNIASDDTDTTIAPDGTLARKFVPGETSSIHRIMLSTTIVDATVYTFSAYVKPAGYNYFYVNGMAGSNIGQVSFNLSTGEVNVATNGTGTIEDVGNGWYRVTVTATSVGTVAQPYLQINSTNAAKDDTFTGDGTSGIYIWGTQLEAGSYPTSYIPTTGVPSTRIADSCTIQGTTFSDWYNQSEGAFIIDQTRAYADEAIFMTLLEADNGTLSERIALNFSGLGLTRASIEVDDGGVSQGRAAINYGGMEPHAILGVGYEENNFICAINGSTATDTSGTVPTPDRLVIYSRSTASNPTTGWVKSILYYPVNLEEATFASETTV